MRSRIKLPTYLDEAILHYTKLNSGIVKAIKKISDFYLQNPTKQTPWSWPETIAAQMTYFLPLNYIRCKYAILESLRLGFFSNIHHVIDFGAGAGSASLAIADNLIDIVSMISVEKSQAGREIHQKLWNKHASKIVNKWFDELPLDRIASFDNTVAIFSFAYTEMAMLPSWIYNCEALIFIEPATCQDGRRLMQLRAQLIEHGYYAWAPCVHQLACPLLKNSTKDWCHERVHWQQPEWFKAIEKQLPIKNENLTFSYLAFRKKAPAVPSSNVARTIGDQLVEKGRTRQLVCRNTEKEFLVWLNRYKISQQIPRGVLIEIPPSTEKKNMEIKLHQPVRQIYSAGQ